MPNPAPGFSSHPDHVITLAREGKRVQVLFNGEVIADTTNSVVLSESGYPAVHYFPPADVEMALLKPGDRTSRCPFKGVAAYHTVAAGGKQAENAAWYYSEPYDEMAEITGYIAFYGDKVTIEEG